MECDHPRACRPLPRGPTPFREVTTMDNEHQMIERLYFEQIKRFTQRNLAAFEMQFSDRR